MPLVNCPECGGGVSSAAPTCPHCGHPNPGRPAAPPPPVAQPGRGSGWFIFAFVLVFAFGLGVFGWGVYRLLNRYNHPEPRRPEEIVDYADSSVRTTPPPELPDYVDSVQREMAREREGTQPPDSGTYELAALDVMPELANRAEVQKALSRNYPPLMRDAGISGTVTVRFRITRTGTVDPSSVEVVESTHEAFSEAAVRVVTRMRFSPGKLHASPVPVWVTLPVTFTIANG